MNVGIIGTRGIPNNYGGFEQFAEYLSVGLIKEGHQVTVYSISDHPYQEKDWNGVKIVHFKDPYTLLRSASQLVYDFNCIMHTRKQNFDIILQLGYTSSSVWNWLLPRKESIITTNMDGLEWKRSKYNKYVRSFLLYAEGLAVKYSHHLIADSVGIQDYLYKKYDKPSLFIPYGADLFTKPNNSCLTQYGVVANNYSMLIARLEPENNVEVILDGVVASGLSAPFLVIGRYDAPFGKYLKNKFSDYAFIKFEGSIYDLDILNNLRHFSSLYFHGHSVGGTNPSLLEAMASQALVCAHNNVFNKSILGEDAFYFSSVKEVATLLKTINRSVNYHKIANNERKITATYSWPIIIQQYIEHFKLIMNEVPQTASKSYISH